MSRQGKETIQETTMEELCKQMEQMQLMVAKWRRNLYHPSRLVSPIAKTCKETGHYAKKCTERPGDRLQCTYCGKHGHSENSCYTKQAYEIARKRGKDEDGEKVTILKNDNEPKSEKTQISNGGRRR